MIQRPFHSRVFWIGGVLSVAVVLFLAFAVFGVQTLFIDKEVNEDFVVEADPAGQTAPQEDVPPPTGEERPAASGESSDESQSGPVRVSSGQFQAVAHAGSGEAIVYRLEDGSHVLRLENLEVDNGPDLFVYAVAAGDAADSAGVEDAGFVSAGRLKGNRGDQTYKLPAEFDPEVHRAISIWCQRFSVNFAAAALTRS